MELTTRNRLFSGGSPAGRLLRRGLLAAVLAAAANALVLVIASSLFGAVVVPPGETLTLGPVVAASAIGAVGAAVVLGVIGRFSWRPIRVFRVTAVVVLLLLLVPIPLAGGRGDARRGAGPHARLGRGHRGRGSYGDAQREVAQMRRRVTGGQGGKA